MFCENCGKKLKEGAMFCTECGAKVNHQTETETVIPAPEQPAPVAEQQATEEKKKNILPIIIIAGVVVVALVIGGIFLVSGGLGSNSDKDRDDEDERTEQQVDDEDTEDEDSEVDDDETEDDTTVVLESYSDVVTEMINGSYKMEDSSYEDIAYLMGHILLRGISAEADMQYDMVDLSVSQKGSLDFEILNSISYSGEYAIESVDIEIEGEPYATIYETSVVEEYLAGFYEGGSLVDYYTLLVRYDDYVAYNGADGDAWISFETYTVYEMDDYILVEAPCYQMDNGGGFEYVYDARILFKITDGDPFRVQAVHVQTYTNEISVSNVTVSSHLAASGEKSYDATNLFDGDIATAWVEGVDGVGVGETIVIDLGYEQKVSDLAFINGYLGSYYLYNVNGKVTSVSIDFGNGVIFEKDLNVYTYYEDSKEPVSYWDVDLVSLLRPVRTDKITITITGAVEGSSYADTCISEIEIH